jgi:dephospho-CoA kinase
MLKVGLTGGIGSGKTTVAGIIANLGIPVYFADYESRKLIETSTELIHSIKNLFGEESYFENELNRKYIANIVFSDAEKLRKLNQIVHPAVHHHFASWAEERQEFPYLIEEAALLFESGAWKNFDFMLLVSAPLNKRIERVMIRDGVKKDDVLNRINSQMPEEEKIPLANFLIFNDDQTMVLQQVLAFHEKIISLNKK